MRVWQYCTSREPAAIGGAASAQAIQQRGALTVMPTWRIEDSPSGLRLGTVTRRALGSEELTWADLLLLRLDRVQVLALYFPSRLDRPDDESAKQTLLTFARNTGIPTSVNFWDP